MKHLLPHVELPFTALISGAVFLALFLAIIVLVYSKGRKQSYEETSMLALDDGILGEQNTHPLNQTQGE